ncbi:polysaccharide biosynthesis protein, partial [mine drainage metagenome]
AAVARYVVPVVFGNRWHFAIFPLIALAAVAPVRLIGSIETPAMTGLGRPEVLLRTKLIIVPCMTVALLIACWFWGIRGAALAWAVVFPLCYGYTFRYVLNAAGIAYERVFQVVRGPILAAALMVLAVLAAERIVSLLTAAQPIVLILSIAIGLLAYPVALRGV